MTWMISRFAAGSANCSVVLQNLLHFSPYRALSPYATLQNLACLFLERTLVYTCNLLFGAQRELDAVSKAWNSHTIRPTRHSAVPCGRPNVLFSAPSLWGMQDFLHPCSNDDITVCCHNAEFRSSKPCDIDVYDACISVIRLHRVAFNCFDVSSVKRLYLFLRNELRAQLNI